jgi:hypothetical protein
VLTRIEKKELAWERYYDLSAQVGRLDRTCPSQSFFTACTR